MPAEIKVFFEEANRLYSEAKKIPPRFPEKRKAAFTAYEDSLKNATEKWAEYLAEHAPKPKPKKQRVMIDRDFLRFFMPLVEQTDDKIEKYRYSSKVSLKSISALEKSINDVLKELIAIPLSPELKDIIEQYRTLKSRIAMVESEHKKQAEAKRVELENNIFKIKEEERTAINLEAARISLEEISGSSDEKDEVEDEVVSDAEEEESGGEISSSSSSEIRAIEKEFDKKKQDAESAYSIYMGVIDTKKYEALEEIYRQMDKLRNGAVFSVMTEIVKQNEKLSRAVHDLFHKFEAFPGVLEDQKKIPLTQEEQKFLESAFVKQVEESENFRLVKRKKTTDELLSLIMPSIHDKSELRAVLSTITDKDVALITAKILNSVKTVLESSTNKTAKEARIRHNITKVLASYGLTPEPTNISERIKAAASMKANKLSKKDREYQEAIEREEAPERLREDVGADLGNDGDRVAEEDVDEEDYVLRDAEEDVAEEDVDEEDYIPRDAEEESDEEESGLDSEDEEEPEIELDEAEPSVRKGQFTPLPLSEGEKLLLDLPMLEMSEKRFKQISREIKTLKEESDMISSVYRSLETNVVAPFLKKVESFITDAFLMRILSATYLGGPIDVQGYWLSAFSLNDEQRFVLKRVEYDQKFVTNISNVFSQDLLYDIKDSEYMTLVKNKFNGAQWLEQNYEKYLPYIPRMIAKLSYEAQLVNEKNILNLASVEQRTLIRHYSKTFPDALSSEEVKRERARFKAMSLEDKLIYGVSIIAETPLMYKKLEESRNRFKTLSDLENKVDYPFAELFQRVARFVPSILLNALIHSRDRIKETRELFVLKFLLSRLSPEQYVYVKVYMGNPDTKDEFDQLSKRMRVAHFNAAKVQEEGLDTIEAINDDLVKGMVLEIVDHDLSVKISEIFRKGRPIEEYEEEFRSRVKKDYGLHKTEYNFLKNCRYQFRRKYKLSLPVIGSVEDMKSVEYAISKSLQKVSQEDEYYKEVNMSSLRRHLEEFNRGLSDVNLAYQLDLASFVVTGKLRDLLSIKLEKVREKITKKSYVEAVKALEEVSTRIGEMLKNREKDFALFNKFYGKEITPIVKKLVENKIDVPLEIRAYVVEMEEEMKKKDKSYTQKAIKVMTAVRRMRQREMEALNEITVSLTSEGLMANIERLRNFTADDVKALSIEKMQNFYLSYFGMIYDYVASLLKKDEFRDEDFEHYDKMYRKMIEESPLHFKEVFLRKFTKDIYETYPNIDKVVKLLKNIYDGREEEAKPRVKVSQELTKRAYAMMSDSRLSYKWEDKGILHLHPELLRIMPNYVIKEKTKVEKMDVEQKQMIETEESVPLSFIRNPVFVVPDVPEDTPLRVLKDQKTKIPIRVPSQWFHPSVLFFHTLLNSVARVEEELDDDMNMQPCLVMNGVSYYLGVYASPDSIIPAGKRDYDVLLQAANVSRVSDIFKTELVVIPSQPRPDMVFEIDGSSLFYPGYVRYIGAAIIEDEKEVAISESQEVKPITLLQRTRKEIAELTRLKDAQGPRFGQQLALDRALLKEKLINGGWKRASINLLREAFRGGVVSGKEIRVQGIDYRCAFVIKNKLIAVDGEMVLSFVREYYDSLMKKTQLALEAQGDIEAPEEFEEFIIEDDEYSGKKNLDCANCNKPINGKKWGNTVRFVEGKAKVVPLCSEKCSEEYHPTK
jgi:hypothetical protein